MVQTRAHTLTKGEICTITISVSLYGEKLLYFAGLLTILDSLLKFKRRFIKWVVIVHHDNSVPSWWLETCRTKENVVLIDETWRQWKDHYRMFWRFLSIPHYACCMVLDLDEDVIPLLHKIEHFWLPKVCDSISNQKTAIFTHIPDWKINDTEIILPGNFTITTNGAEDKVLSQIETLVYNFIKLPHEFKSPNDKKMQTGEARGTSYGGDEMFLNKYLLPQLRIPISCINLTDHVFKHADLVWTFHQ
jgi:hypothetical protein